MNKKTEQQLAKHMLTHRADGYSLLYVLRKSAWRYVLSVILVLILLTALAGTHDSILKFAFLLGAGMLLGAMVRDVGWLRRIKTNWPFSEKVTDWEKVERIARGDTLPAGDNVDPETDV